MAVYDGTIRDNGGAVFNFTSTDFGGATSNSGTANNTAWSALVAAIPASGGRIYIPQGTYAFNAQITIPNNVVIEGAGMDATVLDFSAGTGSFPSAACMYGTGSRTNLPALSTAPAKGDLTLTFASAPSVAAGDVISIFYNTPSSGQTGYDVTKLFNRARDYYRRGEFVRVKSVSGNTVTLELPLYDSYNIADGYLTLGKVTPISARVSDLRVKCVAGSSGTSGIVLAYGGGVELSRLRASNSSYSHFQLDRCYEAVARALHADDSQTAIGYNYGLSISNSQRVVVQECHLNATRHGFAVGGGGSMDSVPNREIEISDSVVASSYNDPSTGSIGGLNFHGNVENCSIVNCHALNGLYFAGNQMTVRGNRIRCTTQGFGIYGTELNGLEHTIEDNELVAVHDWVSSTTAAIDLQDFAYVDLSGRMRICNNRIFAGPYLGRGIAVQFGTSMPDTVKFDLEVSRNDYYGSAAAGSSQVAIYTYAHLPRCFRNLIIAENRCTGGGIYLVTPNAETLQIRGNTVLDAANTAGILVYWDSTQGTPTNTEYMEVSDNTVLRAYTTGISLFGSGTTPAATMVVRGNRSLNNNVSDTADSTMASFYITNADTVILEDNVHGDTRSTQKQRRSYRVYGVTNLYERNDHRLGALLQVDEASVTNRYGGFTYKGQNLLLYASAAPTGGTFRVGDEVENTAPDQYKNIDRWKCIGAGTPGTWRAYGTGRGTTAQRPTLAAGDAGFTFYDTTLTKVIHWNGSSWDT